MCLQIEIAFSPHPETARVAQAAFPQGNPYLNMRDLLGTLFVDEEFADLFPPQGQPAEAPWRLALTCVFQFAEGLSDRQAAEAVRSRIDWKYAQGLDLTDAGFHFSILAEFRQRLIAGGAETRLLDRMLALFREHGLVKAGGRQRTDSTHVLAAVRGLNRLEKVGETLRHALESLAVVAPAWLQGMAPLEWYDRYATRMENYHFPKSDTARDALAKTIGADGFLLLAAIDKATAMPFLQEVPAVKTLRQVWSEQYTPPPNPPRFKEGKELAPSAELIASPYDTEARYSTKREVSWVGYKVHLTETCDPDTPHLITDVLTTVATSPDSNQLPTIHQALKQRALLPKEHLVDAGYPDAETLAVSQHQYGVQVTAPVTPDESWQAAEAAGFARTDFAIDWEAQVVTCPAGKKSVSWLPCREKARRCAWHVRFAKKDCPACPHHAQCTRSKEVSRELWLQSKEEYEALHAARAFQQTPAFEEAYAARAGIEGTHSQGVRRCGLRQARYIGLAKTHLQHIFTACAINLIRAVAWLTKPHQSKRGPSHFAALKPVLSACS